MLIVKEPLLFTNLHCAISYIKYLKSESVNLITYGDCTILQLKVAEKINCSFIRKHVLLGYIHSMKKY